MYAELVTEMEGLRHFQREYQRFADQCGAEAPAALDDRAITPLAYHEWRERSRRVLDPPTRDARPTATALVLQD
jgi:hypothetical protein